VLETRRSQLTVLAAGTGVFLAGTALVWDDRVPAAEETAFEWINGWPDWIAWPLWPVMQFGMVVAPFVAGGLAWYLTRRRQPALGLVSTGFGMWILAKLVKLVVDRPRPGGLLEEVVYRMDGGPSGLGYVSGHAVVGFAIAVIATPYVSKRWATVLWALATGAATLRVYVGAHLPLDSVGGAGLGITAGAVTLLIIRRD
jgi:undecaprenyl-diphosphatase